MITIVLDEKYVEAILLAAQFAADRAVAEHRVPIERAISRIEDQAKHQTGRNLMTMVGVWPKEKSGASNG